MTVGKRLFDSPLMRTLLTLIAATYIRLVYVTGRWTVVGGHFPAQYWDADRPFIMCFWHGRLFMLPYAWKRGKLIHILTSMHRDGRLIGGTVGWFGIKTIDGSSSRGGVAGLRAMIRKLTAGDWVGITPDGPRGPRMRASEGVVSLAR
ncbi:MAG TPA: DUF374 domain-containing protein, partial [Rhodospirillales bacterium]|nr:DUF374 domain-containing protein [Rhodospirillales bacterium]